MPDHENIAVDVPTARGPERRGWHIDKTISVSDLISMVLIVVPALWWAGTVESRFAVTAERAANGERQRVEDRQASEARFVDLQAQLRTMEARVTDRLEKIADKVGASR